MTYYKMLFTNNASTTLSGALANGGTTFTSATGEGSKFPTPNASFGQAFRITLYELTAGVEDHVEVVECTGRTGDTFTITRDVEGIVAAAGGPATGGYAYPSSVGKTVYVDLRLTAGIAELFPMLEGATVPNGAIPFGNSSHPSGSSRFALNTTFRYSSGGVFSVGNDFNLDPTSRSNMTLQSSTIVGSDYAWYMVNRGAALSSNYSIFGVAAGDKAIGGSYAQAAIKMQYGGFAELEATSGGASPPALSGWKLQTASSKTLVLTDDGRLYGSSLHNNAGAITGTTNQYLASGTYTPTLTNVANISASTASPCVFTRVGNVVTVSGNFSITVTASATASTIRISLPVASSLSNTYDLGGTAVVSNAVATLAAGTVVANTVNDVAVATFVTAFTGSAIFTFTFQYEVR